ncbi:MAG: TasA family protein [Acidimicrobiales bacterium]
MLLSLTAALAAVATLVAVSLALYTDTETVPGNTFVSDTVDLTATPATAVVSMPVMLPGDRVTAPVTVTNSGGAELRYAMTSTTTEDVLAGELVLTVRIGVSNCSNVGFLADGTELSVGRLGSVAATAVFGNVASGGDVGDRVLPSAASETLCLQVELPLSAPDSTEGLSTTATFTFEGEQTANNP